MPTIDSLLTIPQAARLAGVSPRTFGKWVAEDRTPEVVRIHRAVRVRASDMNLWIKLGCPDRRTFAVHQAQLTEGCDG